MGTYKKETTLLNLLSKIDHERKEKTGFEKKFGRGKKPYTRNNRIYLGSGRITRGSGLPIGALISAATSLLGPAILTKIF